MKKTNIFLFRDNLASYLKEVVDSETPLIVSKFNKPYVVVLPAEKVIKNYQPKSFFGFLGKGEKGKHLVKRIRRSSKEKKLIKKLRGEK